MASEQSSRSRTHKFLGEGFQYLEFIAELISALPPEFQEQAWADCGEVLADLVAELNDRKDKAA